ncbi:NAD-dependent epimerase/dehydratase family protein [Pseudomonas sp. NA-150]|uniref:NAD-dependent epimerase/dehydratase family protein n=1 Tax=Pseudomonas sp. NA-150 TaxID=3367525 RepID=UPI0037C5FEE2
MNVLLFGATGMVGLGVLRECLAAEDVKRVVTVGRTATGQRHAKLTEIVRPDLFDYTGLDAELQGFDAGFFCLGVSSAGMSEADYSRLTYDITLNAATTLARLNPQMTFVYVSGAGTDSSEQGRSMWARVKGKTENALRRLPFRGVYLFRPGVIQPLDQVQSKTGSYRIFYSVASPLLPLLRWLMPNLVLTTRVVGQAMLNAARRGADSAVLEARDINALANQQV